MTSRHPLSALLMLALLLLRTGGAPAQHDCAPGHHSDGAATSQAEAHAAHGVADGPEEAPSGCDEGGPTGGSHTSLDCGLTPGCSGTSLQLAGAPQFAVAATTHRSAAPVDPVVLLRATRPTNPPPKS